jgi:hypothetical protein
MATAAAVAVASVSVAERALAEVQRFVPHPREAYAEFSPLREPRAGVPVGALWVQGYGPHGESAAPENLETIRGVTGLTMGRNMQLSLTLGLFNFLGIDPGLRNQITARFSDITIVRVKDLAKLSGPTGEPRIYEALKAGTITITTDNNLSLNLDGSRGLNSLPVTGRAGGARARTWTLDARDMFIAMRVVTPTIVKMHERKLDLGRPGVGSARLDDYQVSIDASLLKACLERASSTDTVSACLRERKVAVTLRRASSGNPSAVASSEMLVDASSGASQATLPLPLPVADDHGGLLTALTIDLDIEVRERRTGESSRRFELVRGSSAAVALTGHRLVGLERPEGANW